MDRKTILLFISITIGILIIFPCITNLLMFIKTFKVAGDTNTWIGFIGSFGGAIIGGVISGAITLVGVRLTIENQRKDEFIDKYPMKKKILDDELSKMDDVLNFLEKAFGPDLNDRYTSGNFVEDYRRKIRSLDNLLEEVIPVGGEVYNYTKIFITICQNAFFLKSGQIIHMGDSITGETLYYSIMNKKKEYISTCNELKKNRTKIEKYMEEIDIKFNKYVS